MKNETISGYRNIYNNVYNIFPERWSPRAMSGDQISREELNTLFEAARWAPSSNNNQPWRFIYALKGTPQWEYFLEILNESNKVWAKNSGALIIIVSKNSFDNGLPSKTHSYDTGAAWMSLALQGSINGLVVHGMQGFNYIKAAEIAGIENDYTVEAMAAIGKTGNKENLPENLREREFPNGRKVIAEFAFEGKLSI